VRVDITQMDTDASSNRLRAVNVRLYSDNLYLKMIYAKMRECVDASIPLCSRYNCRIWEVLCDAMGKAGLMDQNWTALKPGRGRNHAIPSYAPCRIKKEPRQHRTEQQLIASLPHPQYAKPPTASFDSQKLEQQLQANNFALEYFQASQRHGHTPSPNIPSPMANQSPLSVSGLSIVSNEVAMDVQRAEWAKGIKHLETFGANKKRLKRVCRAKSFLEGAYGKQVPRKLRNECKEYVRNQYEAIKADMKATFEEFKRYTLMQRCVNAKVHNEKELERTRKEWKDYTIEMLEAPFAENGFAGTTFCVHCCVLWKKEKLSCCPDCSVQYKNIVHVGELTRKKKEKRTAAWIQQGAEEQKNQQQGAEEQKNQQRGAEEQKNRNTQHDEVQPNGMQPNEVEHDEEVQEEEVKEQELQESRHANPPSNSDEEKEEILPTGSTPGGMPSQRGTADNILIIPELDREHNDGDTTDSDEQVLISGMMTPQGPPNDSNKDDKEEAEKSVEKPAYDPNDPEDEW